MPVELLQRYGAYAPRYTSYPTAPVWRDDVDQAEAKLWIASASSDGRALSLYVHVPFCRRLCYYCGCNMMVTRNLELVDRYVDAVIEESGRVAALLPERRPVVQMHWGGGTPTYLDEGRLEKLCTGVARAWDIQRGIEMSIEVHPAVTSRGQIRTLAKLGFNRVSMGVQDFDPAVQQAVNRIQPFEDTKVLIEGCREDGFISVNVDLMYGLPLQTIDSFKRTLDKVEQLHPDRIALFGYAHVPSIKPQQKLLPVADLPSAEARLQLFETAMLRLLAMGYEYIGLDHFALPTDELSVARRERTLRRNFMGYTTCRDSHMLAFGSSSISDVDKAFLQNEREVDDYLARMAQKTLPVARGMTLTEDDRIRRDVLQSLFCNLDVEKAEIERRYPINFDRYFATELERLGAMATDGLVEVETARVKVTPTGQILLRNIASVFDAYIKAPVATATPRAQTV